MPHESADHRPASRAPSSARTKLLVSFGAAVAGGAVAAVAGAGRAAPLIGWDILALVYGSWLWATVWKLDPESAEADARREDPSRDQADLVVLGAAIASLIAVGVVLFGASGASGNGKYLLAGLALGLRVRFLGARPYGVHPEVRAALLLGHRRGNRLQRHRRARLPRLRLPVVHDRDDLPGLRHRHSVQGDPQDGTAACVAVVPAGRRHHRDVNQPGIRAGQIRSPAAYASGLPSRRARCGVLRDRRPGARATAHGRCPRPR